MCRTCVVSFIQPCTWAQTNPTPGPSLPLTPALWGLGGLRSAGAGTRLPRVLWFFQKNAGRPRDPAYLTYKTRILHKASCTKNFVQGVLSNLYFFTYLTSPADRVFQNYTFSHTSHLPRVHGYRLTDGYIPWTTTRVRTPIAENTREYPSRPPARKWRVLDGDDCWTGYTGYTNNVLLRVSQISYIFCTWLLQ